VAGFVAFLAFYHELIFPSIELTFHAGGHRVVVNSSFQEGVNRGDRFGSLVLSGSARVSLLYNHINHIVCDSILGDFSSIGLGWPG